MWLWRLTIPKICRVSQQAGAPGELWYSSILKAGRLETQEEQIFPFEFKGKKKWVSKFDGPQAEGMLPYLGQGQPLCSIQAFKLLDKAHSH